MCGCCDDATPGEQELLRLTPSLPRLMLLLLSRAKSNCSLASLPRSHSLMRREEMLLLLSICLLAQSHGRETEDG